MEFNKVKLGKLSDRQGALIAYIQSLDPALRHTLHIECRGAEPWTISRVEEHTNISLEPKRGT